MNTLTRIKIRSWVEHVDDERSIGNGVIVTLNPGWYYDLDPGCSVRGFDTVTEALRETSRKCVYYGRG